MDISDRIIQGSGLVFTSWTRKNLIHKYADDSCVVVPACNVQSRADKLESLTHSVQANNVKFNKAESVQMIFTGYSRP